APAPAGIYTLSLHDALPICGGHIFVVALLQFLKMLAAVADKVEGIGVGAHQSIKRIGLKVKVVQIRAVAIVVDVDAEIFQLLNRSEEHTSELQSRENLVCRL